MPTSRGEAQSFSATAKADNQIKIGALHGMNIILLLGPDWFKRSGYGCGCGRLRMRMVAVFSGFKRFVRLVLRLKIEVRSGLKRFIAVCMIVSKRCQPLPTAKAAFAGGSGKTNQALNIYKRCVLVYVLKKSSNFTDKYICCLEIKYQFYQMTLP
ncbi:hypothetical protein YC2023_070442 [Brassica napus]